MPDRRSEYDPDELPVIEPDDDPEYEPEDIPAAPTTLTTDDTLDGEDVVPVFRYPIASLFA